MVADALADRGVACASLAVTVAGDWSPGGVVVVTVDCEVDLSDVVLAGFPGSSHATGEGIEVVDVIRGEQ